MDPFFWQASKNPDAILSKPQLKGEAIHGKIHVTGLQIMDIPKKVGTVVYPWQLLQ